MQHRIVKILQSLTVVFSTALIMAGTASAGVSKVLCVPWKGDPNKAHVAIDGQNIDLYAVIYGDSSGGTYSYEWNLQNGTTKTGSIAVPANGIYNLKVTGNFTGSLGATYNTVLTVGSESDTYKVTIAENNNDTKVNIAIDKGLWYIHTGASRSNGGSPSVPMANWGSNNTGTMVGVAGANIWAFEVQGHNLSVEADPLNPVEDPYVDDVQRGINFILSRISSVNLTTQDGENPDSNGNGIGLFASQDSFNNSFSGHTNYENGLAIGAIAGSGAPNKAAATGSAVGRTYKDIVQDMADWYAWSQTDNTAFPPSGNRGGWYYYASSSNIWGAYEGDNSAAQWAYIGLEAAKSFGATVPDWTLKRLAGYLHGQLAWGNRGFVSYRANEGTGNVCLTGGALVGMALVGKDLYESQVGIAGSFENDMNMAKTFIGSKWHGNWDRWERNWTSGYWSLYTMYAVMKGFRVNGIESLAAAPGTADWYNDYVSTLLSKQNTTTGSWSAGWDGSAGWMENSYLNDNMKTAFGVLILTPSVFNPPPVPCFTINPNPGFTGIDITFNPTCSYHSDATRKIVKYEWDWNNDGVYDLTTTTPDIVTHLWPDGTPIPSTFPIKLKVTDDTTPTPITAVKTIDFKLTLPPHPPIAKTGGPYTVSLCSNDSLQLNGSGSFDIDAGQNEWNNDPNMPVDKITAYAWDLGGAPWDYTDASSITVKLSASTTPAFASFFSTAKIYEIGLKVTDNTALAYPTSQKGNLSGEGFGTVDVKTGCLCTIKATPKSGVVQLNWSGAPSGSQTYEIYRSNQPNTGFETPIATITTPYQVYQDRTVVNGTTYYYRIALKSAAGAAQCMSNSVKAKPVALVR